MGTDSARPKSSANYKGFQGGLYENASNHVPNDHDAMGRKFAAQVAPIDGKIVLIFSSDGLNDFMMRLKPPAAHPTSNTVRTCARSSGRKRRSDG